MIFEQEPEHFNSQFEVVNCHIEYDGAILFLKRHENKPEGGTWCVPGGKLDPGEGPWDAVRRELEEETGIVLKADDDITFVKKVYVRFPKYDFVCHVFILRLKQQHDPVLRLDEHTAYAWFTPTEALTKPLIQDEDAVMGLIYGERLG